MSRQLTFDLPVRTALGRDDFFVSPANQLAVALLDAANWPEGKLLLVGPPGSGKSHLAAVWANGCGATIVAASDLPDPGGASATLSLSAVVIEDIDAIAGDLPRETALFHHHNLIRARGGRLLMTSTATARAAGFALPDLASRVEAAQVATLNPPDDALLAAVLVKQFADRQIVPPPTLIDWLLPRIDRSFAAARSMVADLDALSLARQRPVSRTLASELLDTDPSSGP
ncbi:MAG: chromosomal replication initiator DnaA [Paracoccaceae bacterium]